MKPFISRMELLSTAFLLGGEESTAAFFFKENIPFWMSEWVI